jgi:hypothetical protein
MRVLSSSLRGACLAVSLVAASAVPVAARAGDETPVAQYSAVLHSFNRALSSLQSQDMATHVLLMSSYYNIDPRLLVAIVGVESSWQTRAVSHSGAQGLGQLMPATAAGLGVLAGDAYENLDGTARYLRRMIQQYPGATDERRYALAIASYNAGPQAVARFGGIPPFAETRNYVTQVLALWHNLQTRLPATGGSLLQFARTTTTRAERTAVRVAARTPARPPEEARPVHLLRTGSVAEFTSLDASSIQEYLAFVAMTTPPPKQEPKTFKRWFARAFGVAKR